MDTQTQIDRLIELAIIQRSELKQLVEQLPQLREHLNAEVEKVFDETEPQLRAELEEWTTKQTADKTAALGVALEAKIADLAKSLEVSTQARYNAIIAEREQNARLAAEAEAKIAEHAASLPSAVKEIVSAELARFPRAGEIDQLRKEFAEPRGLNPRGKWQAGETYNKLDLVTINGDSYTSNTDGNRTRPSRSSADWTLVAARGTGGGGGPTSLSELTTVPSDGDLLIGSGTSWVTSNLTAGAGISITVGPGAITISATDGDITLDDGTAASPSLHFTNDPDTGIYRPAANTLGISVSGTQVAYFDENGLTVPSAGVVAGGSIHAGNGNANNPSLSFDGDQDTGFFRHQPNEIGIALGGTQYATLTSTTFSITPVVTMASSLRVNGTTDSSSKDTGAIVTEGGLGVEKSASIGGNLTVSGGTGTIDATSGTASATLNLVGRSSGTAKTASVLANSAGSLLLGAEGAGSSLTIAANTGNTTVAYNLTVSGTGGVQLNSVANLTWGGSYGAGIPTIAIPSATSIGFYPTGSTSGKTFELFGTGNATLTGNLTVSGTGTSSVAGNFGIGTTSTSYKVDVNGSLVSTYTNNPALALLRSTDSQAANKGGGIYFGGVYSGTDQTEFAYIGGVKENGTAGNYAGKLVFGTRANGTGGDDMTRMTLTASGNLLIGTTVDSSARLQVGTDTTTAANGMKFGTDVSLYRSDTGVLRLASTSNYQHEIVNTAGTSAATTAYSNTGGQLYVGIDSSAGSALNGGAYAGVISRSGAYSLVLRTNNTTALTLDSSQNATFTGNITAKGTTHYFGADNSQRIELTSNNGSSQGLIEFYNRGTSAYFAARYLASSHTFEQGPIAINNTVQTAAGVSSTHKVTISIGGTTYYLLATNV